MTWFDEVAAGIPSPVRMAGDTAYKGGDVTILEGTDASFRAVVQDRRPCLVHIRRLPGKVLASCTCPGFSASGPFCQHIWASLLAAKDVGDLGLARATRAARVRWAEPPDEEEEEQEAADEVDLVGGGGVEPDALSWKEALFAVTRAEETWRLLHAEPWHAGREVLYDLDVAQTLRQEHLVLCLCQRDRRIDGTGSLPRPLRVSTNQIPRMPDPLDRQILGLLTGLHPRESWEDEDPDFGEDGLVPDRIHLNTEAQGMLVPLLCRTGRFRLRETGQGPVVPPLSWDDAGAWELWLVIRPGAPGDSLLLGGELRRAGGTMAIEAPALLLAGGLVFTREHAARLEDFGAFAWVSLLRRHGAIPVRQEERDVFIETLMSSAWLPRIELPEGEGWEEVRVAPRLRLRIEAPEPAQRGSRRKLVGRLLFDYDGETVPSGHPGRFAYRRERRRVVLRAPAAEQAAEAFLQQQGFRWSRDPDREEDSLLLSPGHLPRVLRAATREGWQVDADGKLYRAPGPIRIEVTTAIDWFDLGGEVEFGGAGATLPALLQALRKGDGVVPLGDGTFGVLPEDWLRRYGGLARLGTVEGDRLRFRRCQVGLLDALLAAEPRVTCDEAFARAREELRGFEGIAPVDPPGGFRGELRAYQRDGLGWLRFLRRFGFGGCLADDMGLGKTVQALALLLALKEEKAGPCLVVAPRSVVFNWRQEAARFAPSLRVLDYSGTGRDREAGGVPEHDLVIATYGTLRRDILRLKDVEFDTVILDESQAIKNPASASAKAARLLKARHRLALSGTPIENHLGELWSLFEFLNPGMLGAVSVFQRLVETRDEDKGTRRLLSRALRPFILRRTKGQVVSDLPEKVEQTLACDLEPAERRLYDELRDHYRRALLARVAREGIERSKIHVLEALLRLRQAACHPGLIDPGRAAESSAKIDLLLFQIAEVIEEGHKVLVFSQFVSLLSIVRRRLEAAGTAYEYLDGQTRDRAERVARFQGDPSCRLFLISLKAGGLGLNLTAADYVYLLDPWWNPAVEAQAIDRTHRIGQTKPVFAYRLIARDTVEEKILQLQDSKRELADAIVGAENSLLRGLAREDLEMLLS